MNNLSLTNPALNHWKGTFELYQDPIFAEIFARNYRLKVLDKEGLLVLARKNPLLGYTHAVIGSPEIKGSIEECLTKISSLNCTQLDIHTTRQIPSLSRHLVSPPDNMNMLIDLTEGEEKIFSRFSKDHQQGIRRGMKNKVKLLESRSTDDVSGFYRLLVQESVSGKRFEIPTLSMVKDILGAGYGQVMVCIHDNRMIGGNFIVYGKHNVIGWSSCYDRRYKNLQVGKVMVYETIKWAIDRGFSVLDFGQQSLSAHHTLIQFKMGFSPVLIPAYLYRLKSAGIRTRLYNLLKKVSPGQ